MANANGNSSTERDQRKRKHILAIDGASEFLEFLRMLFESEHYNVTTTNFVDRSFAMIAALQPDLVIVDLVIGEQAGWDLMEQLHSEVVTQGIPLILTSTLPELLHRAQAQVERYGEHQVMAKPMDIDELLSAVEELIGSA